jgi:hypothetical protein
MDICIIRYRTKVSEMTFLEMDSEIDCLWDEEERLLAFFTRRLIEIAAVAEARGSVTSPTAVLNAMRLPAVALDQYGFVVDLNVAADAVFDSNIKIMDRRLFVRDTDARELLKEAIDQLKKPHLIPIVLKPFIVRRRDKVADLVARCARASATTSHRIPNCLISRSSMALW